jgi:uncharacterized DUF497 family protein
MTIEKIPLFWNEDKNQLLKQTRNIDFYDIQKIIYWEWQYIIQQHPNQIEYPHQSMIFLIHKGYVYAVPCVPKEWWWFLKTAYPTRKANKKFRLSLLQNN